MNLKKQNHKSTSKIFFKNHIAFLLLRFLGCSVSTVLAISVCSVLQNPRGMKVLLYTFYMVTNTDAAMKNQEPSITKDLGA